MSRLSRAGSAGAVGPRAVFHDKGWLADSWIVLNCSCIILRVITICYSSARNPSSELALKLIVRGTFYTTFARSYKCCLPSSFSASPYVLPSVPLFAWLSLHSFNSSVGVCVSDCVCVVHCAPCSPAASQATGAAGNARNTFLRCQDWSYYHIQSVVILAWSLFRIERVQDCRQHIWEGRRRHRSLQLQTSLECRCRFARNDFEWVYGWSLMHNIIGGFLFLTYSRECSFKPLGNTGDGSCWIPGGWDDERSSGGWFQSISVQLTGPTEQCQMLQVHMID